MERQVHAMYFSATGTTEKVVTAIADHIARTWNGTAALRFDFTLPAARQAVKDMVTHKIVNVLGSNGKA